MSELRIIVTGGQTRDRDRDYLTLADIIATRERALTEEGGDRCGVVIVQQGRRDGTDAMARRLARDKGYEIETCEPDYDRYFLDAVTPSNQEMADRGADLCVAMPPRPEGRRRGVCLGHDLACHVCGHRDPHLPGGQP